LRRQPADAHRGQGPFGGENRNLDAATFGQVVDQSIVSDVSVELIQRVVATTVDLLVSKSVATAKRGLAGINTATPMQMKVHSVEGTLECLAA